MRGQAKAKYTIRNWGEYNRALEQRGSLTIWFSPEAKVYGQGEWHARKHGSSKRRTWKKIHLAVCPDSHDIILECTTENDIADCEVLPEMGEHLPNSVQCGFGDGAYDTEGCYRVFHDFGIEGIVPPQSNAILHDEKSKPWVRLRNDAQRETTGLGGDADGRRLWKHLRGYHRRSLAETAMY